MNDTKTSLDEKIKQAQIQVLRIRDATDTALEELHMLAKSRYEARAYDFDYVLKKYHIDTLHIVVILMRLNENE